MYNMVYKFFKTFVVIGYLIQFVSGVLFCSIVDDYVDDDATSC
jgi:hypothetical protein